MRYAYKITIVVYLHEVQDSGSRNSHWSAVMDGSLMEEGELETKRTISQNSNSLSEDQMMPGDEMNADSWDV